MNLTGDISDMSACCDVSSHVNKQSSFEAQQEEQHQHHHNHHNHQHLQHQHQHQHHHHQQQQQHQEQFRRSIKIEQPHQEGANEETVELTRQKEMIVEQHKNQQHHQELKLDQESKTLCVLGPKYGKQDETVVATSSEFSNDSAYKIVIKAETSSSTTTSSPPNIARRPIMGQQDTKGNIDNNMCSNDIAQMSTDLVDVQSSMNLNPESLSMEHEDGASEQQQQQLQRQRKAKKSGSNNSNTGSTGNNSDTDKTRYRPQKYCAVCGDKAIACNFNAVTCESCKAFFRRNAFKESRLKCLFENRCLIDRVTRRFCSKCRLLKCFQIGMKREWILTDEQKQIKRVKIMQNKQIRQQRSGTPPPGESATSIMSQEVEMVNMIENFIESSGSSKEKPVQQTNMLDQSLDSLIQVSSKCNPMKTLISNSERQHQHQQHQHHQQQQQQQQLRSSLDQTEELNGNLIRLNKRPLMRDASTYCGLEDFEPFAQDFNANINTRPASYCSFASKCQYCSIRLATSISCEQQQQQQHQQQQQQANILSNQHQSQIVIDYRHDTNGYMPVAHANHQLTAQIANQTHNQHHHNHLNHGNNHQHPIDIVSPLQAVSQPQANTNYLSDGVSINQHSQLTLPHPNQLFNNSSNGGQQSGRLREPAPDSSGPSLDAVQTNSPSLSQAHLHPSNLQCLVPSPPVTASAASPSDNLCYPLSPPDQTNSNGLVMRPSYHSFACDFQHLNST